jgi:protein TonB
MFPVLGLIAAVQADTRSLNEKELERITYERAPAIHTPPCLISGTMDAYDYPEWSLERGEEGSVSVTFVVTAYGRARDCRVSKSSGFAALDQATCRVVHTRFRMEPARDIKGNPLEASAKQVVVWRLP